MATSFPVLCTRGSYYDVGYSVGSTFQSRIQTYIQKSFLLQDTLLPFYDSREGRDFVEAMLSMTEKNFPKYVDEVRGTAQGAGLPFETLFVNDLLMEIYFGYNQKTPQLTREDLGCSTVYINRPDVKVIGHNEDGEDIAKTFGYVVDATITGDDGVEEKFTSLCYPGGLPGVSIGYNHHGMAFSVNSLAGPTVGNTAPSDFVLRAVLRASSIDEVKDIVSNAGFGLSSGFNINVGSIVDTSTQWSVEVAPSVSESKVSIKEIHESDDPEESTYFHMNEFRHMGIEVETAARSRARFERAMSLPVPTCTRDVRNILGDIDNKTFPIFRTVRPTDEYATVCTGMFDLLDKRFDIYLDNPSKDTGPLLTFNMQCGA
ncbi:acyl-coenzyme A:6-aminopenicillanic-acid-acyltransferase 40 kDa form-like [Haliotis rufescens]|uniref:acyl-coenzyme A:6-aminopenicillanic-acid-acyltransferase 40 kDa form-like n=1 Tax=Haliotis rufescens TaxID=6454 RepID=UPI00201EDC34|nr:acyl-coenzyme A:6-aminopenicillanic-acid-acyltransferase 40 kDa form-like [Haliotis rufescens]